MSVILIFTGGEAPPGGVMDDLPRPDFAIAADSGYDVAKSLGMEVDVVVGDMDSISGLPRSPRLERHPWDKDATDLELALRLAADRDPERIVVVGGGGGRIDHELATAALLCSGAWAGIEELDWVTGRGQGHVVRARRRLHGDVGATISLLPLGGDAVGVTTRGLRWELDGATLTGGTTRGVSNVFATPVAELAVSEGCLLAVVPEPQPSPPATSGDRASKPDRYSSRSS